MDATSTPPTAPADAPYAAPIHLDPPPLTVPPPSFINPSSPALPSRTQQSWGVVISIVIIVLMIVIGAFYAWGKRVAQQNNYPAAQP